MIMDEDSTTSIDTTSLSTTEHEDMDEEEETIFDILTENELLEFEEECYHMMDSYIQEHPTMIANERWKEIIMEEVTGMLHNGLVCMLEHDVRYQDYLRRSNQPNDINMDEWMNDETRLFDFMTMTSPNKTTTTMDDAHIYHQIHEFVLERMEIYETTMITIPRSIASTTLNTNYHGSPKSSELIQQLEKKLVYLQTLPQPSQRTPEWYQMRHEHLTATIIGQLLSSDTMANLNRIIYEKCKPLEQTFGGNSSTSTSTPEIRLNCATHWGQKYEPVTTMIYEMKYQTQVGEFGCIPHHDPQYACLAASPDGINVCLENQERYGRMVEIKNVVSRPITGIPLTKYWIQTQIQMEVCDLEECDFVETKFYEFPHFHEVFQSSSSSSSPTMTCSDQRGIILYFTRHDMTTHQHGHNSSLSSLSEIISTSSDHAWMTTTFTNPIMYGPKPLYIYMPLTLSPTNPEDIPRIQQWIQEQEILYQSQGYILYHKLGWQLETFSCVLIPRNRPWFQSVAPKILNTWQTIVKERTEGYSHRIPVTKSYGCLIHPEVFHVTMEHE